MHCIEFANCFARIHALESGPTCFAMRQPIAREPASARSVKNGSTGRVRDVRQAVDAAAAGARERKLRLYTDMTMIVENIVSGPDIVRPAGVLMPDEKLFVVAVSALGAFGPKVMRSLKQSRSAGQFQRGAASSV